jgi:hypothetical protein
MKPKDRMFPTIEEHYQLQLREVVSESYPQRRRNRPEERRFAFGAEVIDPVGERVRESRITRH